MQTTRRNEGGEAVADGNKTSSAHEADCQWRSKAEEYAIIGDLTGFDHYRAMIQGESILRRAKAKRRNKNPNNNNHPPILLTPEDSQRRSKAEEYAMLADLTGFDHYRAMIQGEAILRRAKAKRRKKNPNNNNSHTQTQLFHAIGHHHPIPLTPEDSQWRSKAEEYAMLADLTGFDHYSAMIQGEAILRRAKVKRRNKQINNKSNESQLCAPRSVPVEAVKPAIDRKQADRERAGRAVEEPTWDLIEISDDDVPLPQQLAVDAAVKENKMIEAVQAVKRRTEGNGDEAVTEEVIFLCSSSSEDDDLISNVSSRKSTGKMLSVGATVNEDGKTARKKELTTLVAEQTVDTGKKKMFSEIAKCAETVKSPETSAENIVLRKLLRKPRYFDFPNGSWAMCLSCGEDHPPAANCTSQKRIKPCFLCGSLQHSGKLRAQGQYVCGGKGHQANDCPEKQENNLNSIICLRCGDSGHDMFSCGSDCAPDDLKKIRCYICNDFGHLSCVESRDTSPKEVSCYNCGQSGQLASECSKCPKGYGGSKSPALCYRCREEGHFARTCSRSRKHARRVQAKMRISMGSSSEPPNCEPQNAAKDAKSKIQERVLFNVKQ